MTTTSEKPLFDRWVVRGHVHVPQALHVGSGSASRVSDSALRRDRYGKPYLPGTSLAGILRGAASELAPWLAGERACHNRDCGTCAVCRLFGHSTEEGEEGHASRVFVEDGRLLTHIAESIEVRDHVGMDRQRGTGRARLQYDQEVAPGNTGYQFELSVDEPTPTEIRWLLTVLDLWQTLGFSVGGRTTTGLGQAKLEEIEFYGLDYSNRVVLLEYLQGGNAQEDLESLPPASCLTRTELEQRLGPAQNPLAINLGREALLPQHLLLTLAIAPLDPLLIGASAPKLPSGEERLSDTEFVTAVSCADDGTVDDRYYLPGSALKGGLRTRAEKIVRTLNYHRGFASAEAAQGDSSAEATYRQRIAACAVTHSSERHGEPERLLACFGTPARQRDAAPSTPSEAAEKAWEVYEQSCITCRMFGNSMMRGRISIGDGDLCAPAKPKLFDHVAIDRFSGGAADARKFDTRPLLPTEEALFRVRIHLQRFEPWMLGLLVHLLKDLYGGEMRLGRATHRGYGRVRGWVEQADLLVLPGSQMAGLCEQCGLEPSGTTGPYRDLTLDLVSSFAQAAPGEADTPVTRLLRLCDAAFQQAVREGEQRSHGEVRHD